MTGLARLIQRPNSQMAEQDKWDWVMRHWPKNVSNQVAIQQGTFTNNSPGAGSVAWAGVVLEYKNQYYQITDGNTADPWIYWEIATPTTFLDSATFPTLTADGILIGKNATGSFISAWRSGQGIPAEAIFDKIIANQINVSQLSAISADLGTITAGTVTGATIQTSATASTGIKLDAAGFKMYDATNTESTRINTYGQIYTTDIISIEDIGSEASAARIWLYGSGVDKGVYIGIYNGAYLAANSGGVTIVAGNMNVSTGYAYQVNGVQVVAARQAHIGNPTGGATVDAEARTAINSILSALETHGLLASS